MPKIVGFVLFTCRHYIGPDLEAVGGCGLSVSERQPTDEYPQGYISILEGDNGRHGCKECQARLKTALRTKKPVRYTPRPKND